LVAIKAEKQGKIKIETKVKETAKLASTALQVFNPTWYKNRSSP